jgi:hypothetical protein
MFIVQDCTSGLFVDALKTSGALYRFWKFSETQYAELTVSFSSIDIPIARLPARGSPD